MHVKHTKEYAYTSTHQIPPTKFREDTPTKRTLVFDRLTFPKRVVNINK